MDRARYFAPVGCGCLLLLVHVSGFGHYVADDAAISLAYAKHLVEGAGLVLTPGDAPVEGYSNPLWVALLAIGALLGLGGHPVWLFKSLGFVCGAAAVAIVPKLADRAYGTATGERFIAPIAMAAFTPFAFWAVAGLENPLYAFLLSLAALLYLRERDEPSRRSVWSAVALALVALTRPEGIAFACAFLIHRIVTRAPARTTLFWLATIVAIVGGFLLWRHWYFADWLPNTFYAKIVDRYLRDLPRYAADSVDPGRGYLTAFIATYPALAAVAAVGILDRRFGRANLLFAGIIATQALFVLYAGGDWWTSFRFLTVLVPILAVLLQHGASRLLGFVPGRRARLAAGTLIVAACLIGNLRVLGDVWRADPESLVPLDSRLAMAAAVKSLAALTHIDEPTYLEPDIGGPSLAGGLRVIDLGMLADVHLARFHYYPPFFRQYIFDERKPDFIRTHSVWSRASGIAHFPELRRDYLPVSETVKDGELAGFFARKDRFVRAASTADVPVARFGELSLLRFELADPRATPGGPLTFTWEWRCADGCQRDYRLYIRLAGASEIGLQPVFGWYPTSSWDSGEVIRTTQSVIAPKTGPSNSYKIEVGASPAEERPRFIEIGSVGLVPAPARPAPDRAEAARLLSEANRAMARGDYHAAFVTLRRARALDPGSLAIAHRLEDARENAWWIDYYADTGQTERLMRRYRLEAAAGPLRAPRAQLDKLYFALWPHVDRGELDALRRNTARVPHETAFSEDGTPVVTLLDYRVDRGDWGVEDRLTLYFEVERQPRRDYQIWIHAYAPGSRDPVTAAIDPSPPIGRWQRGRQIVSHVFQLPPGDYDLRAGFWQPHGSAHLCPQGNDKECYLLLGTHRFGS